MPPKEKKSAKYHEETRVERTRAVIFDLFGTLVPPVDQQMYRESINAVSAALQVDAARVVALWFEDASFRKELMTSGTFTLGQIEATCIALRVSRPLSRQERAAAIHLASHRDWMTPWPDAIGTLQQLRTIGMRLGLISDCSISVPELWSTCAFKPFFDDALFSCVEGATKPAPQLYESACRNLGVRPNGCIYVGDSVVELEGATAAGMSVLMVRYGADEPGSWSGRWTSRTSGVLDQLNLATQ